MPQRRRTLRRVLVSLGVLGLVGALVTGGALWFFTDRYAGNIDCVSDDFIDLDAQARPAPATSAQEAGEQPITFLLVGTDTRPTHSPTRPGWTPRCSP